MATVFTAYFGYKGPANTIAFNRDLLSDLLADSRIDGYTLVQADGYFNGAYEPSAVVTVICQNHQANEMHRHIHDVCTSYKHAAEQEAVWLTCRQEDLLVV
jgi:hypothetical protein